MGAPPTVDFLFVELSAKTEGEAGLAVERAIAELGQPGWQVKGVLADPDDAAIFGVEVYPAQDMAPSDGWDVAHALAARLGGRAEAVLRATLDEDEAKRAFGSAAEEGAFEVYRPTPSGDWHLVDIAAMGAWAFAKGEGILIGHPDTGTTTHPELARIRIELGKNLLESGLPAIDPRTGGGQPGHGTATSSLMVSPSGAQLPEQQPISGLAPEAEVVPIRVTETVVILGWQGRLAEAIEHATKVGCHVISMSLGGLPGSRLHRAIRAARKQGVIVVAAAGNYVQFVVWPAAYPEVIGVAASEPGRKAWLGSSKGPSVDITAPGAQVHVAQWEQQRPTVGPGNGTSFATALMAAVAALWLSRHMAALEAAYPRHLWPKAFRANLTDTARNDVDTRPFPKSWFGAGMVDCQALLEAPLPDIARLESIEEALAEDAAAATLAETLTTLTAQRRAPGHEGPAYEAPSLVLPPVSSALATELLQHLILDDAFREQYIEALAVPEESVRAVVPAQASSRLREALATRPRHPDAATTERVRLEVEVTIRVGDIRVEAL